MRHISWKPLRKSAAVILSVLAASVPLCAQPLSPTSSRHTASFSSQGNRAGNGRAYVPSGPARAKFQISPPPVSYSFGLIDVPFSTDGAPFGINDPRQMVGGYNDLNLSAYAADHGFVFKGKGFATINYPGALQE